MDFGETFPGEPKYAEDDCQDGKTTNLNWLPPKSIDRENRHPVAWNGPLEIYQ